MNRTQAYYWLKEVGPDKIKMLMALAGHPSSLTIMSIDEGHVQQNEQLSKLFKELYEAISGKP